MADLLTHLLAAYAVLTVLGWRVEWLTRRWVVVGTGGAAIPDLLKVELLLEEATVGRILGVPFDYDPVGSLFGLVVIAGAVAVHFGSDRRRAYLLLLAGGSSALVLDGLRAYAGGRAFFWLYPLWWRPPTPGLYVTADPRVLGLATVVAGLVYGLDRWVAESGDRPSGDDG